MAVFSTIWNILKKIWDLIHSGIKAKNDKQVGQMENPLVPYYNKDMGVKSKHGFSQGAFGRKRYSKNGTVIVAEQGSTINIYEQKEKNDEKIEKIDLAKLEELKEIYLLYQKKLKKDQNIEIQ